MRLAPLLALALAALPMAAAQAKAPPADPCGPEQRDPSRLAEEGWRIYQRAVRDLQPREPRAAIAEFERALRCYNSVVQHGQDPAKIYHPLGLVYQRLGRYTEALAAYKRFLADVPEAQRKPGVTKQIQDRLAELRAHVAELAIDTAEGLEVRVDDQAVGQSPLPRTVPVTPGTHVVRVGDARRGTAGAEVTVQAGEVRRVDLTGWRSLEAAQAIQPSVDRRDDRASAPPRAAPRPERRLPRPRWRLIVGGSAMGAGALLAGFGTSALAVNGRCIDPACSYDYSTTGIGAGLLAPGLALSVGGAVLLALPGVREPQEARLGAAPAPSALRGALVWP